MCDLKSLNNHKTEKMTFYVIFIYWCNVQDLLYMYLLASIYINYFNLFKVMLNYHISKYRFKVRILLNVMFPNSVNQKVPKAKLILSTCRIFLFSILMSFIFISVYVHCFFVVVLHRFFLFPVNILRRFYVIVVCISLLVHVPWKW